MLKYSVPYFVKRGETAMRRIFRILILLLCLGLMTTAVSAQSSATEVSSIITVTADGRCQITTSVHIHLDRPSAGLTFPLPKDATNVAVNGTSVPAHQLRDRIRKLSYEHIEYVLDGLQNSESPIKNMRAFLLTALYNAPGTMALYYTNAIRQKE